MKELTDAIKLVVNDGLYRTIFHTCSSHPLTIEMETVWFIASSRYLSMRV